MKAFIEISKATRKYWEASMPFVYAMCRNICRDSVRTNIEKYEVFKQKANEETGRRNTSSFQS
jgi:hypothetical protein